MVFCCKGWTFKLELNLNSDQFVYVKAPSTQSGVEIKANLRLFSDSFQGFNSF